MAKTISPETWMLLVGVLGLLAVVACSFSALQEVFGRVTKRTGSIRLEDDTSIEEQQGLRYEDEDGEATEQTLKEFQDAQRWQRWAIVGASVVGFGVGLAQAVVVSVTGGRDGRRFIVTSWMLVACWMVLSLQPISLFTEPSSVKRYNHGIKMFWESILSIVVTLTQLSISWTAGYKIRVNAAFSTLLAAQITIASLRAILSILIPRRPNVYFEGQVVDQEYSATAYNRFTYGWATTLLKFASKNKGLGIDDLPKLPYTARAETVHARLEKFQAGRKLWVALVMRHRRALVVQGLLSLVVCIIGFGPQVAMYKILKVLEDRSVLSMDSTAAWVWVGALGVLLAMSSSIESWLWWLIYSDLWVPIYAGLSGLVFAKSMRCKDVKSVKSKTMHEDDWESEDEEEGEEQERNRQSIINLAAVDSKRIADFVTFSYLIPSCVIRLAIATVFLARLIGWPSLLAGIGGAVLLTPFNSWLTKRYALAQEELMKASDKRTSAVTEVLQGIRQVKFGALEQQWEDRISEKREAELSLLWKTSVYTTGMVSVWIMGPLLLSAISLTVYAYTRGELSPSVAFTALSIFGSLESSLAGLPDLISKAMEAKVSADRIDTYLASAEKVSNFADVDCITFSDATVAWPSDENEQDNLNPWESDSFTLTNLNLKFPPKGLSVIVGKTGSGKSLLLASILGECDVLQGSIKVPRSLPASQRFDHLAHRGNWILDTAIAYVAQNPWMENASIKENILFGLPYDRTRYRETLFASGLEKDMTILPDGDLTDIGANGINLSGGQRWRVSFARALYSRAGILILDDIFSALDAETGRHAYEHALTGKLGQGRTRILVTHHVGLCLPRTDYCVLLEDGGVSHAGTVEELQASGGLSEIQGPAEVNRDEQPVVTQELPKRKRSSAASAGRRSSVFSMKTIKKFMQEEERETGSISLKVYTTYLNKGNGLGWWILAFLCYAAFMALLVGRSWWVSVWTSSSQNNHHHPTHPTAITHQAISLSTINTTQNTHHDLTYYLTIYIAISALACLLGTLRCLALALAFIHSSRRLFTDLLSTILRAPLRWLDTVPLGRILNRFTSDIYLLDWRLGYDIGHLVYKILELAGILVAGVSVSPLLLLLALALLTLCARLCSDYLSGVRELKRLESLSKSPYLEKFSTSLSGLSTLRAFQKSTLYITEMHKLITRHATASWYLWLFNRWLGFWMALVGALFSLLTAGLVVSMPGISAALAGFAMSFALQYNYAVAMGLRFYANVEIDMNATERILEYTNIETESKEGYKPPPSWPARGSIEVEDLTVAYDTDLPPVLKNVSFKIENNTRVGVVGRTGAGKSSLTLALFRFLEAQTGRILIDGIDISVLDLTELRGRLAIIPQDPVLFSGTVRSNLDPFGEFSEEELYHALRRVHLVPSSSSLDSVNGTRGGSETSTLASPGCISPTGGREGERDEEMSGSSTLASPSSSRQPSNLNLPFHIPPPKPINHSSTPTITLSTAISPAGTNLSHGQRQLLSLARALLRHPPILILDEATSAVDTATDALIQSSIRSEFGRENSSLLVIAHRLSTIADFDRILVLDEGRVVEWGAPRELMGIEGGVFRNLVQKSGEKSVVEGIIFGGGKCKDV